MFFKHGSCWACPSSAHRRKFLCITGRALCVVFVQWDDQWICWNVLICSMYSCMKRKSKERGRASQCDQRRKLFLNHQSYALRLSVCSSKTSKQHHWYCRGVDECKSLVFIHPWFLVHRNRTPWATKAALQPHAEVRSLGRMIDEDLVIKFDPCPTPYLYCGSLCKSWRWATALLHICKRNVIFFFAFKKL